MSKLPNHSPRKWGFDKCDSFSVTVSSIKSAVILYFVILSGLWYYEYGSLVFYPHQRCLSHRVVTAAEDRKCYNIEYEPWGFNPRDSKASYSRTKSTTNMIQPPVVILCSATASLLLLCLAYTHGNFRCQDLIKRTHSWYARARCVNICNCTRTWIDKENC